MTIDATLVTASTTPTERVVVIDRFLDYLTLSWSMSVLAPSRRHDWFAI